VCVSVCVCVCVCVCGRLRDIQSFTQRLGGGEEGVRQAQRGRGSERRKGTERGRGEERDRETEYTREGVQGKGIE
jgi:hypothetical protein